MPALSVSVPEWTPTPLPSTSPGLAPFIYWQDFLSSEEVIDSNTNNINNQHHLTASTSNHHNDLSGVPAHSLGLSSIGSFENPSQQSTFEAADSLSVLATISTQHLSSLEFLDSQRDCGHWNQRPGSASGQSLSALAAITVQHSAQVNNELNEPLTMTTISKAAIDPPQTSVALAASAGSDRCSVDRISDQYRSTSNSKSRDETDASRVTSQPCQVCGEAASGYYFGALVCLPCKSFFIRSTKAGDPSFSPDCGGKCDVQKSGRIRCQFCRFQKCLFAGMSRKEKPEAVVPVEGQVLCKVCNDIANGVHFGVITCEGCKKFFRRGLKENRAYICKAARRCTINPRMRNNCRHCRYQKCLQMGMSPKAVKLGRPKKGDVCLPSAKTAVRRKRKLTYKERENLVVNDRAVLKMSVAKEHAGVDDDESTLDTRFTLETVCDTSYLSDEFLEAVSLDITGNDTEVKNEAGGTSKSSVAGEVPVIITATALPASSVTSYETVVSPISSRCSSINVCDSLSCSPVSSNGIPFSQPSSSPAALKLLPSSNFTLHHPSHTPSLLEQQLKYHEAIKPGKARRILTAFPAKERCLLSTSLVPICPGGSVLNPSWHCSPCIVTSPISDCDSTGCPDQQREGTIFDTENGSPVRAQNSEFLEANETPSEFTTRKKTNAMSAKPDVDTMIPKHARQRNCNVFADYDPYGLLETLNDKPVVPGKVAHSASIQAISVSTTSNDKQENNRGELLNNSARLAARPQYVPGVRWRTGMQRNHRRWSDSSLDHAPSMKISKPSRSFNGTVDTFDETTETQVFLLPSTHSHRLKELERQGCGQSHGGESVGHRPVSVGSLPSSLSSLTGLALRQLSGWEMSDELDILQCSYSKSTAEASPQCSGSLSTQLLHPGFQNQYTEKQHASIDMTNKQAMIQLERNHFRTTSPTHLGIQNASLSSNTQQNLSGTRSTNGSQDYSVYDRNNSNYNDSSAVGSCRDSGDSNMDNVADTLCSLANNFTQNAAFHSMPSASNRQSASSSITKRASTIIKTSNNSSIIGSKNASSQKSETASTNKPTVYTTSVPSSPFAFSDSDRQKSSPPSFLPSGSQAQRFVSFSPGQSTALHPINGTDIHCNTHTDAAGVNFRKTITKCTTGSSISTVNSTNRCMSSISVDHQALEEINRYFVGLENSCGKNDCHNDDQFDIQENLDTCLSSLCTVCHGSETEGRDTGSRPQRHELCTKRHHRYWHRYCPSPLTVHMTAHNQHLLASVATALCAFRDHLTKLHRGDRADTEDEPTNDAFQTMLEKLHRHGAAIAAMTKTFMLQIPGGRTLAAEDVELLTKQHGFGSALILLSSQAFDAECGRFRELWNWTVPPTSPLFCFSKQLLSLAGKLHELGMDKMETALLCALALFSTDTSGLKDKAAIQEVQGSLLNGLEGYISSRDQWFGVRVKRLFSVLPDVRLISAWYRAVFSHIQCKANPSTPWYSGWLPPIMTRTCERYFGDMQCTSRY